MLARVFVHLTSRHPFFQLLLWIKFPPFPTRWMSQEWFRIPKLEDEMELPIHPVTRILLPLPFPYFSISFFLRCINHPLQWPRANSLLSPFVPLPLHHTTQCPSFSNVSFLSLLFSYTSCFVSFFYPCLILGCICSSTFLSTHSLWSGHLRCIFPIVRQRRGLYHTSILFVTPSLVVAFLLYTLQV